jgi:hypothetical protein
MRCCSSGSHAVAYGNSNCNSDAYSNSDAVGNPDRDSYSDSYSDTYPDGYADTNADAVGYYAARNNANCFRNSWKQWLVYQ